MLPTASSACFECGGSPRRRAATRASRATPARSVSRAPRSVVALALDPLGQPLFRPQIAEQLGPPDRLRAVIGRLATAANQPLERLPARSPSAASRSAPRSSLSACSRAASAAHRGDRALQRGARPLHRPRRARRRQSARRGGRAPRAGARRRPPAPARAPRGAVEEPPGACYRHAREAGRERVERGDDPDPLEQAGRQACRGGSGRTLARSGSAPRRAGSARAEARPRLAGSTSTPPPSRPAAARSRSPAARSATTPAVSRGPRTAASASS